MFHSLVKYNSYRGYQGHQGCLPCTDMVAIVDEAFATVKVVYCLKHVWLEGLRALWTLSDWRCILESEQMCS